MDTIHAPTGHSSHVSPLRSEYQFLMPYVSLLYFAAISHSLWASVPASLFLLYFAAISHLLWASVPASVLQCRKTCSKFGLLKRYTTTAISPPFMDSVNQLAIAHPYSFHIPMGKGIKRKFEI